MHPDHRPKTKISASCVVAYIRRQPMKPWLLLGKGPTTNRLSEVDLNKYHVLTLNHACLIAKPTLGLFIDTEAWLDCRESFSGCDRAACLPWWPHTLCHPDEPLYQVLEGDPIWESLMEKALALSFNSTTASRRVKNPDLKVITVRYFSAVAGLNLLAAGGVRQIDALGVDGGTKYADAFEEKDRLRNGRESFDIQFGEMRHTIQKHRIRFQRLFHDEQQF